VLSGAFECGVHGVPHTSESGQVPQSERVLTKELSRAKLKLTPLVYRHLIPPIREPYLQLHTILLYKSPSTSVHNYCILGFSCVYMFVIICAGALEIMSYNVQHTHWVYTPFGPIGAAQNSQSKYCGLWRLVAQVQGTYLTCADQPVETRAVTSGMGILIWAHIQCTVVISDSLVTKLRSLSPDPLSTYNRYITYIKQLKRLGLELVGLMNDARVEGHLRR
jgi:hypothetical protein